MSIIPVAASTHRAMAGLCLACAVAVLSGCAGGASSRPETPVTVTITPTITAKPVQPTTTVATTTAATAKSDVVGRKFDLGTIVSVQADNGVPVIVLDRWSARGVSDSTIAAQGVPIQVHSDAPFANQNTRTTYRIPVAQGAVFTYLHCVSIDQPPVQKSSTLDEFAHLQDPEKVVLVTLDTQGQAVTAENDPAC